MPGFGFGSGSGFLPGKWKTMTATGTRSGNAVSLLWSRALQLFWFLALRFLFLFTGFCFFFCFSFCFCCGFWLCLCVYAGSNNQVSSIIISMDGSSCSGSTNVIIGPPGSLLTWPIARTVAQSLAQTKGTYSLAVWLSRRQNAA